MSKATKRGTGRGRSAGGSSAAKGSVRGAGKAASGASRRRTEKTREPKKRDAKSQAKTPREKAEPKKARNGAARARLVESETNGSEGRKRSSRNTPTPPKAETLAKIEVSSAAEGTVTGYAGTAEIVTYANAVKHLYERVNYERMRVFKYDERSFKLDRMRGLMDQLGNPQDQVRTVHVAGTVGKGSTVAMIASMLQGCGYAVGQYTSPHLIDIRERVSINGHMIGRTEFTELTREVAAAAKAVNLEPTFFEMVTAVAFKHFADQAIDIAVIEVGLGGRLDSTNVITPEVSVVCRIDYDHIQILGRTLTEITKEKAGIFKKGVPVITCEQADEVEKTLREAAEKAGTTLRIVNKDIEFSSRFGTSPDLGPHTRVCLITEQSQFMHLPVPLSGEHQAVNCGLALAAIDSLRNSGFEFPESQMHAGLAATKVPGRMELIWDRPRILVDGAHNPASVGALMRCVGAHVPYDSMVCIFGCCEDKDVASMLDKVALGGDKVIFTRASTTPRAADPHELQRRFAERSGKMSQVARTLPEALDLASRAVGRDDLICVTGSFYLVGETKKYLTEMERKKTSGQNGR